MTELPERIASKFDVADDGCWEWTAAKDPHGYGRVRRVGGGAGMAHRVVYELLRGEIGREMVLDHLCRNTSCVNPDHLEPVTNDENVRRGKAAETLRAKYAVPRDCPAGHSMTGDNLYIATTSRGYVNRMCRECRRLSKQRQNARLKAARAGRQTR